MSNERDEIQSMLTNVSGLTSEQADELLTFLIEQKYLELEANQSDTARAVFMKLGNGGRQAVSYKPRNILFNFKKTALSIGTDAVDVCLGLDSLLAGGNAVLYLLLLCLKTLTSMRTELSPSDGELLAFLWNARRYRRLQADDEYEVFRQDMTGQGKNPPSRLEYHHSLDRLAELSTLRLEEGMIQLREKVVIT